MYVNYTCWAALDHKTNVIYRQVAQPPAELAAGRHALGDVEAVRRVEVTHKAKAQQSNQGGMLYQKHPERTHRQFLLM